MFYSSTRDALYWMNYYSFSVLEALPIINGYLITGMRIQRSLDIEQSLGDQLSNFLFVFRLVIRVRLQIQNMTSAAKVQADMKAFGHLS